MEPYAEEISLNANEDCHRELRFLCQAPYQTIQPAEPPDSSWLVPPAFKRFKYGHHPAKMGNNPALDLFRRAQDFREKLTPTKALRDELQALRVGEDVKAIDNDVDEVRKEPDEDGTGTTALISLNC